VALGYEDASSAGIELDDAARRVPGAEAGTSLRLVGRYESGLRHRITPRLAVQWWAKGEGDALPALDFDAGDALEEDLLLGLTELDTDLVGSHGRRFRARALGRWALRDEDAPLPEPQQVEDYLYDLELTVEGSPIATWELSGRGLWTGAERDWTAFDARTRWIAHPALALSLGATWQTADDAWQYRPGIELTGNRYRLEASLTWEDGDAHQDHDRLRRSGVLVSRRMVDGVLGLEYAWSRTDDDGDIERRIMVSFTADGLHFGY
jgi:hypothetical protein